MERLFLGCFAGRFKAGYAEFAAFQLVALAPLRLQRLGRGYAGTCTAPRPAEVSLDVVAAAGKSVPIVVAFGISGDGKHLPSAIRFDAFDDVDSRHIISPASRILADSKGDSTRSKR